MAGSNQACDVNHPAANAIQVTEWWRSPTVIAGGLVIILGVLEPELPPTWGHWASVLLRILAGFGIVGARAVGVNAARQAAQRGPRDGGLKVKDVTP